MIILGLADIHEKTSYIDKIGDKIASSDLIMLIGDITHFGKEEAAAKVIQTVNKYNSKILAVSGNCDHKEVDIFLDKNNINLHGKSAIIDNIGFIGAGASLSTPFNTPNEISESDYKNILDKAIYSIPSDIPLVLMSHQPPFQTLTDRLSNGTHVGSHSVKNFINKHNPLVCLTGHIHESKNIDTINQTKIINPGPLWDGHYIYLNISDKIEELKICSI